MLDEHEQLVVDNIARFGWHGMAIHAEGEASGFCYSIGLDEFAGAPELIIFGLEHDAMHSMMWEIARQFQAGRLIVSDMVFNDLIPGRPCIVRPVHQSWFAEYFGFACWYYYYREKFDRLQAFQVFWPGERDGLFPWQQGCAAEVMAAQPLLYNAMIEQADV